MSALARLGNFVATADPPEAARDLIATAVADCFGCILAGAESPEVAIASAALSAPHAPILGTKAAAAPGHAALMNAIAGHVYELDDWEDAGNTHATVVLLPALLSAAARHPVSGRQMAAAFAVGFEVIARLGQALGLDHYARGFHATATLGSIGAAAACARLMGTKGDIATHAMAIATSQANGYTAQFGSNAKVLQTGFAARNGIEAALLAASGMTGNPGIIEHPSGFAAQVSTATEDGIAAATASPGHPWALTEFGIVFKPWPSCGYAHRLMTAALTIKARVGAQVDEIAAIEVTQNDIHNAIVPYGAPTSRTEALFSLPACIAQTLVHGGLSLADLEAGFWTAPEVARLIDVTRVSVVPARNPALNMDPDQPDELRVTLSDGTVLHESCVYPLGMPQNPLSPEALADKFASITGRPATAFETLLGWGDAPDVTRFFQEAAER